MTGPGERIQADLLELKDTCTGIRKDTDEALQPGISDVNGKIFRGLTFGTASESGEVDASRNALADALAAFHNNGDAHVARARQVIAFLDKLLVEYKTADDFAKLDVDSLLTRFAQAVPPPPPPSAETRIARGSLE